MSERKAAPRLEYRIPLPEGGRMPPSLGATLCIVLGSVLPFIAYAAWILR